jgi:hypothetical protein
MSSKVRGQKSLEDNNLVTTKTIVNHNKLCLQLSATINNAYIVDHSITLRSSMVDSRDFGNYYVSKIITKKTVIQNVIKKMT